MQSPQDLKSFILHCTLRCMPIPLLWVLFSRSFQWTNFATLSCLCFFSSWANFLHPLTMTWLCSRSTFLNHSHLPATSVTSVWHVSQILAMHFSPFNSLTSPHAKPSWIPHILLFSDTPWRQWLWHLQVDPLPNSPHIIPSYSLHP